MRSKGTIALIVIVLLLGVGGCAGCNTYNSLVGSQESVRAAWSDVETQYQRRADLIPNLVSTVRGAANFEQETLQAVTEARAQATSVNLDVGDLSDPQRLQQFQQAQAQLSGALGRLLAVSENYPELQSVEAFRDLQAQLEGTENRIAVARRDYNQAAQQYNTQVRRFPTNLVANVAGFDRRAMFEAEQGAEDAPEVNFN
jgi:LemA protein